MQLCRPVRARIWKGTARLNAACWSSTAFFAALALLAGVAGIPRTAQAQAQAQAQAPTEQSIVVLVNDDPISAYDIEQRERFLAITTHEEPSAALKKKATDMLIEERLQVQQAKKLGLTPPEDDVNKVLTDMAQKNNMTPDQLATALGEMGVNIKTLKDRIRSQIVWQGVVQRKFRLDVVIGDAAVDKALSEGGEAGKAQDETALQLRQVKFEIPSNADQAAIAKQLATIEALRARIQSCSNFATLTKGMQGMTVKSLQDQVPTSLAQPVRTLVMNAKVGEMTPPTLSGSAIEAYAVCGKHAIKGDPEQREQTERKLMEQEMGIRAEGLLRDIRQDAFIEYR
jgi:peptidyl-prolyl cis-trans isomerase SurA